jgi:hypothetical protein
VSSAVKYALFSGSPAPRILVDQWRVNECAFLYTLLYPQIRFDILIRISLIDFDKVLKDFCVGVREDDTGGLCGGGRISTRVLETSKTQ